MARSDARISKRCVKNERICLYLHVVLIKKASQKFRAELCIYFVIVLSFCYCRWKTLNWYLCFFLKRFMCGSSRVIGIIFSCSFHFCWIYHTHIHTYTYTRAYFISANNSASINIVLNSIEIFRNNNYILLFWN